MGRIEMPPATCPIGYTVSDLAEILGDRVPDFSVWMVGKTQGMCVGEQWDYDAQKYMPDACGNTPHGIVTYRSDLERYIVVCAPEKMPQA